MWGVAIAERLEGSGVRCGLLVVLEEDEDDIMAAVAAVHYAACAVLVDAGLGKTMLEELLKQVRRRGVADRVVPVLLPGANEDLVAQHWPQWDWVDLRHPDDHEEGLKTIHAVARGRSRGDLNEGGPRKEDSGNGPSLGVYIHRIAQLERLSEAGLSDEARIEAERKIVALWMDDPEWHTR